MKIILNGQAIESQQSRLDQLLLEQGYAGLTIATALNQQFVARAERADAVLNDGDNIEVVAPMQGG